MTNRWRSLGLFTLVVFLAAAMHAQDPAKIKKQLERMDRQFTADGFLKAVDDRDVKAVRLFLAGGIDVNARNSSGESALHLAADNDDAEMVALLLKSRPDINAKDERGKTPLLDAATNGQGTAKTIPLLIAGGADLGIHYKYGTSIVFEAANSDNAGTLLALIKAGAKLDAPNEKGETPLQLAASMGRKVTPILIKAGANLNARDEDGQTPLVAAATTGETEAMRLLIDANADVNAADKSGRTALINVAGITSQQMHSFSVDEAAITGTVDALIAAGADVKAKNKLDATTPLIAAAREGHADSVSHLIAAKAPLNSKTDPDGFTALMEAAKAGHADVVKLLVAAGADVKLKDRTGRTATKWAADYPDIVATLGGGSTASGSKAKAPAPRAAGKTVTAKQKADAQQRLEDLGYRYFDEDNFVMSAAKGEVDAARAFLDYGLSVDSKDSRDHTTTPLLNAASNDDPALGLFLIEQGANVNAKDDNGSTPLLLASSHCSQTPLLAALIKAGADVNAKAAGGATPAMMAEISKCSANLKALRAVKAKK
jgi:ankyrin repeat protein